MAEAHQAVLFRLTVTEEGLRFELRPAALRRSALLQLRSCAERCARAASRVGSGLYPATPRSLVAVAAVTAGSLWFRVDPPLGVIERIRAALPQSVPQWPRLRVVLSAALFSLLSWSCVALSLRGALRLLLLYRAWIFEPHGRPSAATRAWITALRVLCRPKPKLYSFQGALPRLPVPALRDTIRRYLDSVRPLMDDERFAATAAMAEEFRVRSAPRLQRLLQLRAWYCSNYVSDWWEQFVYLRSRAPIMVNSNYYAMDFLYVTPSRVQAARAGNAVCAIERYRQRLQRGDLQPTMLMGAVPMCSAQFERMFNTTRVPGTHCDTVQHVADSSHVTVFHRGRYFRVWLRWGGAPLGARDLEEQFRVILSDSAPPAPGEARLAALTATDRTQWAQVRARFFAVGANRRALDVIERSAFFVALDDGAHGDIAASDSAATAARTMSAYGKALLHGDCCDRWFDKSFTLVVFSNGKLGANAEHSWADAPIIGHLWEFMLATDAFSLGYTADGHCVGELNPRIPEPQRLQWDLSDECCAAIDAAHCAARALAADVDLFCFPFTAFGKGLMKRCRLSPDAFIQIALQLAHMRDRGGLCLTYEASMTRLFRYGRTETVRSCTARSAAFVRAMADSSASRSERRTLLAAAAAEHQRMYRTAMAGGGVDRHLFCLYVASRILGVESPFLKQVLSEPWRLSTSQTPQQQLKMFDLNEFPDYVSTGGGFGPVADDGYGVSYIIAGENLITFHISSKHSSSETDSERFGRNIAGALEDIAALFDVTQR